MPPAFEDGLIILLMLCGGLQCLTGGNSRAWLCIHFLQFRFFLKAVSFAVCSTNFSGSYITYITHLLSDLQDVKPGLGLALCVRFCWLVLFGSVPQDITDLKSLACLTLSF